MALSRKALLVLLVLAMSLLLAIAMDICKEKDKPNFQLKLLGTALFKEYLLLITRDDNHEYTVYKVPFSHFDNSYGQMLLNIKGVPIEEYWPTFKDDAQWKEIRANVITIWLIDKVKPYLYFFCPQKELGKTLDVENGTWSDPLRWGIPKDAVSQWISTADTSRTYTNKIVNDVYMFYVWKIGLDDDGKYTMDGTTYKDASYVYYTENKNSKKVENITFINNYGDSTNIITEATDPYRNMPGYDEYRLVNLSDWHSTAHFEPPGFIFKGQFHIFDLEKVFIFADRLSIEDPGGNVGDIWYSTSFKAVPHKDFFKCSTADVSVNTYPPDQGEAKDANAKSSGSLSWLWIVLVIILVALLLMCLAWFFFRSKKPNHKSKVKHAGHSGSHHSKKSRKSVKSSRGGSSANQTRRSTLMASSAKKGQTMSKGKTSIKGSRKVSNSR